MYKKYSLQNSFLISDENLESLLEKSDFSTYNKYINIKKLKSFEEYFVGKVCFVKEDEIVALTTNTKHYSFVKDIRINLYIKDISYQLILKTFNHIQFNSYEMSKRKLKSLMQSNSIKLKDPMFETFIEYTLL